MILMTERLCLRSWQEGDAAELYVLARDSDVGPRCGWVPHENENVSLHTIRTILADPETYAITDRASGRVLGSIGLHLIQGRGADERELGYWVGKAYWGRGYTPEAAEAALRHAFTELGCTTVWVEHFDFNDQSRRVIEKCGFTYLPQRDHDAALSDGVMHHLKCYRMTAEEWRARHG